MTAAARKQAPPTGTQAPATRRFQRQRKVVVKGPVETAFYGQAVRRMIRAFMARADTGDLETITELTAIRRLVGDCLTGAARTLHDQAGYPWSEIGRAAGISKQAAASRWGGAE